MESLSGQKHALVDATAGLPGTHALSFSDTGAGPKRIRGGGNPYAPEYEPNFEDDPDFFNEGDAIPEEMDIAENMDPSTLGLTAAQRKRWSRPPVPSACLDVAEADLNMQWLDIDMIGGAPLPANPNPRKKQMVGAQTGQVPVIRIFGVTDGGNSVVSYIHGYTPYGYFGLPEGYVVY